MRSNPSKGAITRGLIKYSIHSTVDQYKRAAPNPVAKSIEPHEKYENVFFPSRINFLRPIGKNEITIKNTRIKNPINKKSDSKFMAK